MEKFFEGVTFLQVISQGFAVVFGIFIMWMAYKYIPKLIETGQAIAVAIEGLKTIVLTNQTNCQLAQSEYKHSVGEIEKRLIEKLEDIKRICVEVLKAVEWLQAKQGG